MNEHEEWEAHGCSNGKEYRDYLNRLMWEGYTPEFAIS